MLLAIRNGDCESLTAMLAGNGENYLNIKEAIDMTPEEKAYIRGMLTNLDLTKEERKAFEYAIDGIKDRASFPINYSMSQNYPNPFNPSTTINYSIPEGQKVKVSLKIFDLRGVLIQTLVEEEKESGFYRVYWNGTNTNGNNVSSGVYFYRIHAGNYVKTKKMVLLK